MDIIAFSFVGCQPPITNFALEFHKDDKLNKILNITKEGWNHLYFTLDGRIPKNRDDFDAYFSSVGNTYDHEAWIERNSKYKGHLNILEEHVRRLLNDKKGKLKAYTNYLDGRRDLIYNKFCPPRADGPPAILCPYCPKGPTKYE